MCSYQSVVQMVFFNPRSGLTPRRENRKSARRSRQLVGSQSPPRLLRIIQTSLRQTKKRLCRSLPASAGFPVQILAQLERREVKQQPLQPLILFLQLLQLPHLVKL